MIWARSDGLGRARARRECRLRADRRRPPSASTVTTTSPTWRGATLVVEAVREDEPVKRELLRPLARPLPDGCAARHARPRRSASRSWPPPAATRRASSACTSSTRSTACSWSSCASRPRPTRDPRARAIAFCEAIGKTAVEVPDEPGFVVNRLLFPYLFDAVRLLERTGLEPAQVDACMKLGASHPMGPLELLDLVGLDVAEAIGEALHADTRRARPPPARPIKELVARGQAGPEVRRRLLRRTADRLRRHPAARSRGLRGRCSWRGALRRLRARLAPWARGAAGSFLRPAMSQITSASLMPWSSACSIDLRPREARPPAGRPSARARAPRALPRDPAPTSPWIADQILERLKLAFAEPCAPHSGAPPRVGVGGRASS